MHRSTANFFDAAGQSTFLSKKNKDLLATILNADNYFSSDVLNASSVIKILNFTQIKISELFLAFTAAAKVKLFPCLGHYNSSQSLFIWGHKITKFRKTIM